MLGSVGHVRGDSWALCKGGRLHFPNVSHHAVSPNGDYKTGPAAMPWDLMNFNIYRVLNTLCYNPKLPNTYPKQGLLLCCFQAQKSEQSEFFKYDPESRFTEFLARRLSIPNDPNTHVNQGLLHT